MKQTISILTALIAVVMLATGMIVITNLELSRNLESCENQLLQAQSDLADAKSEAERRAQESAAALKQAEEERDTLRKQLQEAAAQQILESEQLTREWQELEQEYQILIATCRALENELQAQAMARPVTVHEPAPSSPASIPRSWIAMEY